MDGGDAGQVDRRAGIVLRRLWDVITTTMMGHDEEAAQWSVYDRPLTLMALGGVVRSLWELPGCGGGGA